MVRTEYGTPGSTAYCPYGLCTEVRKQFGNEIHVTDNPLVSHLSGFLKNRKLENYKSVTRINSLFWFLGFQWFCYQQQNTDPYQSINLSLSLSLYYYYIYIYLRASKQQENNYQLTNDNVFYTLSCIVCFLAQHLSSKSTDLPVVWKFLLRSFCVVFLMIHWLLGYESAF